MNLQRVAIVSGEILRNIMKTISIDYPDSIPAAVNLSSEAFEEEARLAMAIKLFELGRLTSGQAAELAGISRAEFLLNSHRFGACSVIWDDDELKAEFG